MDRGCGTLFQEEFSRLLTDKKWMSDMVDVLTDLYNSDKPFTKMLASWDEAMKINDPYFGLFVGTQPDRLSHMFRTVDITGGLIPRIITLGWKPRKFQRKIADRGARVRAVNSLKALEERMQGISEPIEIDIEQSAIDELTTGTMAFMDSIRDDKVRACYARPYDTVLKLALLYKVNESTEDGVQASQVSHISQDAQSSQASQYTIYTPHPIPTEYIYSSGLCILANCVNVVNLGLTSAHIRRAISMYFLTIPWTQLIADASSQGAEERGLVMIRQVMLRMIERGEVVEILDGNGSTVKCLLASDVLKNSHMRSNTFNAYMDTIIQHLDFVGPPIMRPSSGVRPVKYYPIKIKEDDQQ
jgi:hypothetical protein